MHGYNGWAGGSAIAVEKPSIDAERMWQEYIKARRPVVIDGLLDDKDWKGTEWTVRCY